jgi:hypothetical protein
MRIIAIFAALLAVAFASPNLEARQQGEACKVYILCDDENEVKGILPPLYTLRPYNFFPNRKKK